MSRVSRRGKDMSTVLFAPRPLPDDLAKLLTANVPEWELVAPRLRGWLNSANVALRQPLRLPEPVLPPAWNASELVQARRVRVFEASVARDRTYWTVSSPEDVLPFVVAEVAIPASVNTILNQHDRAFEQFFFAANSESFFSSLLDGFEIVYRKRSKSFRDFAQKFLEAVLIRIARILATARARLLIRLDVNEPPITVIDMPEEPGAPHRNPSASKEVCLNRFN